MQSVTVRKVVKLQLNYQCLHANLQYRPVRREERDVHSSSLLIDVYALS